MIGSCENALRMVFLDAGRGAGGKIVEIGGRSVENVECDMLGVKCCM